ncbi:AarF/ABC1/UbiB kinase family protein, partial [Desulfobacterales bacterium HSG16]|nr:AarF/ABC1/UbiB kinase family protein [Desulfobacterales bacterium HSG16]
MLSIRKIGVIGRTYRHMNRYRQILSVLIKYGFGDLVERLDIEQYFEVGLQMISQKPRPPVEKLTRAIRLRMVFEELGPACTKLGQILSTRPDLVPKEFAEELTLLQDSVKPRSFEEISKTLKKDLGQEPDKIFEHFSKTPLAAASIGQVHRARLKSGEDVAVKIRRIGIRKLIEVDLEIMLHLATLMEKHLEVMKLHRPVRIIEEFAKILEKELDYTHEAAALERFSSAFLKDQTVLIPAVFKEISTTRVLVMEFIKGIKISERESIESAGLDRKIIVSRGANLFLKQIFEHGFFHADPHPGNIFVLPNNVICLLDFGMIGIIDRATREDFLDLIDSVVHHNESKAARVLLQMSAQENDFGTFIPDSRMLEKDIAEFMGRHLYKPLKDIAIGKLLNDLLDLAGRHRLRIPPDVFLMMKVFSVIEGIGMVLDPDFNLVKQATPFIEKARFLRFHPQRIADDALDMLTEIVKFMHHFPKDTLSITNMIRRKNLTVKLDHQGIDDIIGAHDRTINKLSFSIIIAALIIGSALIVISNIPPLFYGISVIGIVFF